MQKLKHLILGITALLTFTSEAQNNYKFFYVGTYTDGEGKGIYLFKMNSQSGGIDSVRVTENIDNPSYLTIDRNNNYLYAVSEVSDYDENKSGSVSAFKINIKSKELIFINTVSSGGAHPCYVTIDAHSNFVLAANYTGGNICVLPIDENFGLKKASDIAQHSGSSVNEKRQSSPHAHSVYLGPENKFAYAVDLGIDKINIFQFNSENGKLIQNDPPFFKADPGSGPRHMAFHPDKGFAYLINELDNKIIALKIDKQNGGLKKIESYPTLPKNFEGTSYCSDIHIHPNGKYLYGSNRGDNSIVIFEIDKSTGKLNLIGHESTRGDWPRNFVIDPSGTFLLAANQKSNNITVFKIDVSSGSLTYTGISESLPSPVCLKFLSE
jgi:6-phosphogluconolactonase